MRKQLKDLTIKDAFMFAAVMSDAEQCRRFLEIALEMKILEVHTIAERSFSYHPEYHGVRLDVWAEEMGTRKRFNVEMQVKQEDAIDKRSRYYHAQMDMDALLTGKGYESLPDTYVIFICDFDPFGDAMYRYTIRRYSEENRKTLNDGQVTVYLSSKGTNESEVPKELVNFLKYVKSPKNVKVERDSFVNEIEERIKAIKRNRDWEAKFMLLEEMMRDERKEGERESLERVNKLNQLLAAQNRIDDIVKSASDSDYQQKLFKEFKL